MKFIKYSIPLVIIVVLVVLIKINYESKLDFQNAQQKKIQSLIEVGMEVDFAISLLEQNGFDVSEKHNPTDNSDYTVVHVRLFEELTVIDTIAEVFGFSWNIGKSYVVLMLKDGYIHNIIVPGSNREKLKKGSPIKWKNRRTRCPEL